MNKTKVFLLPYAGASSLTYYKWEKRFPSNLEPFFVELAGRGERTDREFYKTLDEASDDVAEIISENIGTQDYFIFGHSMGALISFETYYKLEERGVKLPSHIFFSGRRAPQLIGKRNRDFELEDDEFLQEVAKLGGLPDEFYEEEIKQIFLPILRSDFRLVGEYEYREKLDKIQCDITILYGKDDFCTKESEIRLWDVHAGNGSRYIMFKGNHFFLNEEYPQIINLMAKTMSSI